MYFSISGILQPNSGNPNTTARTEASTNGAAVHSNGSCLPAIHQTDLAQPTSYDRVPYPKNAHRGSHPRTAEAIATLFGMQPQPLPRCRVLELGCAAGWNLIPQAVDYPDSQFVGVDLSKHQIGEAQSMVHSLGLNNIDMRQASIVEIDRSWGAFDYIICHGVYSWVSTETREKILAICRENLSRNGVAYVSYNVYPGWGLRGTIRELMLYHTAQFDDPHEQISQAREVLDFMADNCTADTPYGRMIKQELEIVRKADDGYLFHDHIEEHNSPVYFHQFAQHAGANGLQYLADIDFSSMLPRFLTEKAHAALANASLVKQEQYMDFLRNRTFRRTLLCREDVPLNRCLQRESFAPFHILLTSKPETDSLVSAGDGTMTLTMGAKIMKTASTVVRSALEHLIRSWPRAVTLDELHLAAVSGTAEHQKARSDDHTRADLEVVAASVMHACSVGLLEFFVHPPQLVNVVSARPVVSPWVRLQAKLGCRVTNQLHDNITLGDFSRYLVSLLDSQHDRTQLADEVEAAIARDDLTLQRDRQHVQQVDRKALDGLVGSGLNGICKASLLTA